MPAAHENFMKRRNSIGATQMQRVSNASVAYLLRNSHSELLRDAEENGNVIPSLRMQALRINPLNCRFRDDTIIRWSTRDLVYFSWLLNHVIYLKLR